MAIISGDSGGAFSIPLDVSSAPAGTRLIVDEFGDLIVVGVGAVGFVGVSTSPDVAGDTAFLSSSIGVGTAQKDIAVRDALGEYLGAIEARGYHLIAVNAAPPDGDLSAGQAWLWYDDTNGAGRLVVKAKQADGTVKTGSFAVNT